MGGSRLSPISQRLTRVGGAIIAALLLAGCAAASSLRTAAPQFLPQGKHSPASPPIVGNYIKHVVIIIQENRSFENLFAGFPGADAPLYGNMRGNRVTLHPVSFEPIVNVDHFFGPAIWHDARWWPLQWRHRFQYHAERRRTRVV